jgi:hypothetical protein
MADKVWSDGQGNAAPDIETLHIQYCDGDGTQAGFDIYPIPPAPGKEYPAGQAWDAIIVRKHCNCERYRVSFASYVTLYPPERSATP